MEHGRGRHLRAEPEPSGGFGAVDLDRLAIAARHGLDQLVDVGKDGADKPTGPRANENAVGETLDLALCDKAGKRPVDGATGAVLEETGTGKGNAS